MLIEVKHPNSTLTQECHAVVYPGDLCNGCDQTGSDADETFVGFWSEMHPGRVLFALQYFTKCRFGLCINVNFRPAKRSSAFSTCRQLELPREVNFCFYDHLSRFLLYDGGNDYLLSITRINSVPLRIYICFNFRSDVKVQVDWA